MNNWQHVETLKIRVKIVSLFCTLKNSLTRFELDLSEIPDQVGFIVQSIVQKHKQIEINFSSSAQLFRYTNNHDAKF